MEEGGGGGRWRREVEGRGGGGRRWKEVEEGESGEVREYADVYGMWHRYLPTIIFLGVLWRVEVLFHREPWSRVSDFCWWRLSSNVCCMVQSRDTILPATQEVL